MNEEIDMSLLEFNNINIEKIESDLHHLLINSQNEIEQLISNKSKTWDNFIVPLDSVDNIINNYWSPIQHLYSVKNNIFNRDVYSRCLEMLSQYSTKISHNIDLFNAFLEIKNSEHFTNYTVAQKKYINNEIRDFQLNGVHLNDKDKKTFKEITESLAKLNKKFNDNVLDCTNDWSLLITNEDELDGVLEVNKTIAHESAINAKKKGWLLKLDAPCFLSIMMFANNRELRKTMYSAYITRASNANLHNKKYDNSINMEEILNNRYKLAKLLGFNNYAELSLVTKMANTNDEVTDFIRRLAKQTKGKAQQELQELESFACKNGITTLEPWDLAYYSEKLKKMKYDFSSHELQKYFPVDKVLTGLFTILNKLYNYNVNILDNVDVWHEDVKCIEFKDNNGQVKGYIYLDLYARQHKRGGAWMDEAKNYKIFEDKVQIPIAFCTCNFTPPVNGQVSTLNHDEVITLFHEFGHCIHHVLTTVDVYGVSGIHGVPWDGVELPSQFFENWCWNYESINYCAEHIDDSSKIPQYLFDSIKKSYTFQAALGMMRQLEFSIFDFSMHANWKKGNIDNIYEFLETARQEMSVVPTYEYNRFAHGFSHIFAGGYSAGYYSYKWAEVLALDAFDRFDKEGIFNQELGQSFLNTILSQGGSDDFNEMFKRFRGREASIDAILNYSGISE